MIIITGANGHFGRLVVNQLLLLIPAAHIGVTVRDVHKANDLVAGGIRVRQADFDIPESLDNALADADVVLLVSTTGPDELRVQRHRNAIDAVQRRGVSRLVYTSQVDPDPQSPYSLARVHYATEAYLGLSNVPHTIIRNGFYADLQIDYARQALHTGVLATPADGPVAYVARADLAEATAHVLVSDLRDQPLLTFTGSEAIDHTELAGRLSRMTGRQIMRQVIDDTTFYQQILTAGIPPYFADWSLGMFQAARQGRYSTTETALAQWLGRQPISIDNVVGHALEGGRV